MPRTKRKLLRKYYVAIALLVVFWLIGYLFVRDSEIVERYYSQGFYPLYSLLPQKLLSWLPVSFGDLFYVAASGALLWLLFSTIRLLILKRFRHAGIRGLQLLCTVLILHHFFYLSWGVNYYRKPLEVHYQLDTQQLTSANFLSTLDSLIAEANRLRVEVPADVLSSLDEAERLRTTSNLEQLMRRDTIFAKMWHGRSLSKAKSPLSSTVASYFTVTGYFNPFTHEVQVNQLVPWTGYPFTTIHELAHQRGIGFEDECNFIAFQMLKDHPNGWYAYSAYYAALQSFLRELRFTDEQAFKTYLQKVHPLIIADFKAEREFWEQYQGTVNYVSGIFYNQYLQHNNQPEGMQRYGMMNRLIIAWQKKNKQLQ